MAGNISTLSLAIVAAAALSANRLVKADGTYAVAGEVTYGVTRTSALVGDRVALDNEGTATVEAGGVVAVGAAVQAGVDGKCIAGTTKPFGRAVTAASAAGQLIEVWLMPIAS